MKFRGTCGFVNWRRAPTLYLLSGLKNNIISILLCYIFINLFKIIFSMYLHVSCTI